MKKKDRQMSVQYKSESQTYTARYAPQTFVVRSLYGMKPNANDDDDDGEAQHPDHFEGDPRPLPYDFQKELISNSNKHIRICEVFGPSTKVYPMTSKFYAKYESHGLQLPQRHKVSKLSPEFPMLESQVYGWIPLQCREAANYLNCINAPKRRCRMTIHGEQIIDGRITERPAFNGLQFILH